MKVVITVGLPGCGKSTYLARLGVNAISSDEIRRLIADNPEDQTIHVQTFATIRYLVRQRLAVGRPVTYVDATHLTIRDRQPYVELARMRGCELEALVFDVPLEVCLERNKLRSRMVPEAAIREMAAKMKMPTVEEGFQVVTVLSPNNELR